MYTLFEGKERRGGVTGFHATRMSSNLKTSSLKYCTYPHLLLKRQYPCGRKGATMLMLSTCGLVDLLRRKEMTIRDVKFLRICTDP